MINLPKLLVATASMSVSSCLTVPLDIQLPREFVGNDYYKVVSLASFERGKVYSFGPYTIQNVKMDNLEEKTNGVSTFETTQDEYKYSYDVRSRMTRSSIKVSCRRIRANKSIRWGAKGSGKSSSFEDSLECRINSGQAFRSQGDPYQSIDMTVAYAGKTVNLKRLPYTEKDANELYSAEGYRLIIGKRLSSALDMTKEPHRLYLRPKDNATDHLAVALAFIPVFYNR